MRTIPVAMGTQHPDNASKYISIQEEVAEAVQMLSPDSLGLDEVMIDFEGKITPFHQPMQVAAELLEREVRVGEQVFITPRLASAVEESPFRQLMALLSIVEANHELRELADGRVIFEMVIPMVGTAQDLLEVRQRIKQVVELAHAEGFNSLRPDQFYIIPLVEDVSKLVSIQQLLGEFVDGCAQRGMEVELLRVMIGRSDPALRCGLVAAVLSNKLALSECHELAQAKGFQIAPIWGAGALPFRGHLTAENLPNILQGYRALSTVTIQSGLRYDRPPEECRRLVKDLRKLLPRQQPLVLSREEKQEMLVFLVTAAKWYVQTLQSIGPVIAQISDLVPRQRDRLTRHSLAGYGRQPASVPVLAKLLEVAGLNADVTDLSEGPKVLLPRVIAFTAAMYTIGIPPEFVGTGRGLLEIRQRWGEQAYQRFIDKYYPTIATDLAFARRYLHLDNAAKFLPPEGLHQIKQDVKLTEDLFKLDEDSTAQPDEQYLVLMETVGPILRQLAGLDPPLGTNSERHLAFIQDYICQMGDIRGSLG